MSHMCKEMEDFQVAVSEEIGQWNTMGNYRDHSPKELIISIDRLMVCMTTGCTWNATTSVSDGPPSATVCRRSRIHPPARCRRG